MEIEVTLPYRFKPYPPQARALRAVASGIKRVILPWSRRSGKDMFAINLCVIEATKVIGTYFYMFPTAEQARKAIFQGFTNDGRAIISYIPSVLIKTILKTKLQIELINGSIIEFIGSDEAKDKLAGSNPKGVIFSESALSQEEAWTIAVRPILMGNNGWVLFISTYRGNNWFQKLSEIALDHPQWYVEKLNIVDTGLMNPIMVLNELLASGVSSFKKIRQELFNVILPTSDTCYFESELQLLEKQGKINDEIDVDGRYPIHTCWDIGLTDKTTIWFFQFLEHSNSYRFCYYYEATNTDLETDIESLREIIGEYEIGYHFFPHDGGRRQKSDKRTLQDIAEEDYELDNVEVIKVTKDKNIQISELRNLFPRMEFCMRNEGIKDGVESLYSYHEKTIRNKETGEMIRTGKPSHSGSDPVDSLFAFSSASVLDLIDNNIPSEDNKREFQLVAVSNEI